MRERRRVQAALALCAASALAMPLAAQTSREDPSDLQAWLGAGVRFDLPRRWESSLEYRARMVDDASDYRGSYVTAQVGRNLTKRFSTLVNYRLATVDEGTFHRYGIGAEQKGRVSDVRVGFRTIVQYQKQNFEGNDEASTDTDTFLRTRLEIERPVAKRLDVYASTEPYFKLGEGGYPVDNWRNTVGLQFEVAKGRAIDVFYIYRPDYGKSYNRTFHVIGVDLELDVKVGRKDK